jgi:hypothetical protein
MRSVKRAVKSLKNLYLLGLDTLQIHPGQFDSGTRLHKSTGYETLCRFNRLENLLKIPKIP